MGWRIHFTAADLARTRVSATLGPLAETICGLLILRTSLPGTPSAPWRGHVRGKIRRQFGPLLALLPKGSLGTDLWTLTGEAATIEEGLDRLLALPPAHLRGELDLLSRRHHVPQLAWQAVGRAGRLALAGAAQAAFRTLVEPHWPRMRDHLDAERVRHGRIMLDGGPERLLSSLGPRVRWTPPVLEVLAPEPADIHLDGRGVTLVPSVFGGHRPLVVQDLARPENPPLLIFAAAPGQSVFTSLLLPRQPNPGAVKRFLGVTRAALLTGIAEGCAPAELRRRTGLPQALVDSHALALSRAGLIQTGPSHHHSLTSLGAKLLAGP
jgi:hypothetical protein